ncbi:MAG: NAD(P)H-dependent oxidoreductase subunit E [Desulfobacterales bacterium]|nr:NAD(P)H-dependent oxidoreductase subunit E [Desulfobacterales bacterium]
MTSTPAKLSPNAVRELRAICQSFGNDKGELINILHKAQDFCGYLPPDVQEVIADELDIPVSTVYGVVTFYSLFVMEPRGKYHISICTGTACFVKGAMDVMDEFKLLLGIEPGETTPDGKFSIDSLRCIGACGLAPVVMVGDKIYGRVTADDVMNILDDYKEK